jgi:hypothetical protein
MIREGISHLVRTDDEVNAQKSGHSLDKILNCSKKCPGVVDRASCIEEWRFGEPDCAFMHAEE